jgi:nitroimidazol reductase NimA-like FMN-containing flavoprotein (pyridoxamine 5'-phosphate oxidase superfamily)
MNTPVTTLDRRFSEPDATAADWNETSRVLQTAELFWISTVRADGRPHVTPVVAVWVDGALYFCTGAGEQKFLNLRANPHVVLTTGCNSWEHGLDVVVEGDAARVTDEETLRRVAAAFTTKWDGSWQYQVRDGSFFHSQEGNAAIVFSVPPAKVFAHSKGSPFGATTHKF